MDIIKKVCVGSVMVGTVLLIVIVLCLLMAFPFMWMWNFAVVSAIMVANKIGFWASFWLMIFISLFLVGLKSSSK